MTAVSLDDLRARNARFRLRSPKELLGDLPAACTSLGAMADHGITVHDLDAITRTAEGARRLLVDLRTGGDNDAT